MSPSLGCSASIDPDRFEAIRRTLMLDACKWDAQVGDSPAIAPFAIVLARREVASLFDRAERLAAELTEAEVALLGRPDLVRRLGLPRAIRRTLAGPGAVSPGAARVVRFDFHPTRAGWAVSEANADVPGGYAEAGDLPRLMAEAIPGTRAVGDPGATLARAVVRSIEVDGGPGRVGLLVGSGHAEDHQVVAGLDARLGRLGLETVRAHPRQVAWDRGGVARIDSGDCRGPRPVGAIVRFYQAEWLADLAPSTGWPRFFREGRTPATNPGSAILVESKRLGLVLDALGSRLPTWRRLVPGSIAPRPGLGPGWVIKPALGNNGDDVALDGRVATRAILRPGRWVAQRRFEAVPLATPIGPRYPCLGVYVIDGRAAGIYGRVGRRPLIDREAADVAVLATGG